jgi:FkbM family methyltransferase
MLARIKNYVRSIRPLYRQINRFRGSRLHEPILNRPVSILGSDYGAWGVDLSLLNSSSTVYSVGIGEDVTFDLSLISAVGCEIHAFDPTPIAVEWIRSRDLPVKFHFHAIGLGSTDSEVAFQVPPIAGWHSFSLHPEPNARVFGEIVCPIRRLQSLMALLGHARIDLLKMDIEGFEYSVVEDIISSKLRPKILLIEFHHGYYGINSEQTHRAVRSIQDYGFDIFWLSDLGREYGFIDRGAI